MSGPKAWSRRRRIVVGLAVLAAIYVVLALAVYGAFQLALQVFG